MLITLRDYRSQSSGCDTIIRINHKIQGIRNAANTALALSADRFRREVEQLAGQRHHYLKRGPKSKPEEEFLH